jgi:hypothetical protein
MTNTNSNPNTSIEIVLVLTFDRSVVFSSTPVSSTNKTDRHDKTEILLKVALSTITPALHRAEILLAER